MKTEREKVLEGQRNRAYAGLHAERKRADKLEAANAIMGFIGVVSVSYTHLTLPTT